MQSKHVKIVCILIHGAGAGAMHKICKLLLSITKSPQETSVIIFLGGRAHIPKNISYKVKMRKVIVCKAPLHQMIAYACLID